MELIKKLQLIAAAISCVGLVLPTTAMAEQPMQRGGRAKLIDVALENDNALYGKVVDANGTALTGLEVKLQRNSTTVATGVTQEEGRFRIGPLRGGVYSATVGRQLVNLRVWTKNSAPPAVTSEVLLVGSQVSRAQSCPPDECGVPCTGMDDCGCGACGGGILGFLSNPWVIAAGIAAGIAIPLALDDDDAS